MTYYMGPGRRLRPNRYPPLEDTTTWGVGDVDLTVATATADIPTHRLAELADAAEEAGDQPAWQTYRAELNRRRKDTQ